MPAAAWMTPAASSTSAHSQSLCMSWARTPASIALPMIAGMTDWATIQMEPNVIPPMTVAR